MNIAVILNSCSVGGYKWVLSVFGCIKHYYPDTSITIFVAKTKSAPADIIDVFKQDGLSVKEIKYYNSEFVFQYKKKSSIKVIDKLYNMIRKQNSYYKFLRNQKKIGVFIDEINKNYDIVFDAWPYIYNAYNFSIPSFFIPHDFINSHFFGFANGSAYKDKICKKMINTIKSYFDAGYIPMVSSDFIKNEIRRLYPDYKGIIYSNMIVSMSKMKPMDKHSCNKILQDLNINSDFILYATNDSFHKNSQACLSGYYYIKQKYPNLKLIICGYNTDGILLKMNTPWYGDHIFNSETNYDVMGLGLVSEKELIALMQSAKLVLNTSLCEAACGSGLDAWSLGIPTAISNIPCYMEQIEKLGIKSEIFDPKNCQDIAVACLRLLDNPEYAKENAKISMEKINSEELKKNFASSYMNAFLSATKKEYNK